MWILATLLHTCYYILQWNLNIPSIWQVICFETMLVIKVKSSISIYILFFSTKKTSQYIKLLVTSNWLCRIKIKNTGSSTLSQVAWMLRVWLFIRICPKRADERLSCETYVLTSKGEMKGTIYSGEKIQSFVCCSTVIKQRRFQRMYSMCDFQNSTVVFPI